jgi:hypothetical protein
MLGKAAAERFQDSESQVEFRFYSGLYKGKSEETLRAWAEDPKNYAFKKPIKFYNVNQVIEPVSLLAESSKYVDDPSLVAIKAYKTAMKLAEKSDTKSKSVELAAELWGDVALKFPVGTRVKSIKDELAGLVVGYSNQKTSYPYVTVLDERTGFARPRAASTLKII